MAEVGSLLEVLQANPAHLSGTDVRLAIPISRRLLNEVLAARPAEVPIDQLLLNPEANNTVRLHLAVRAPVIGAVKRQLTLRPAGPVSFPQQPWLHVDIVDGFKLFDKPVINLLQRQIDEKLPKSLQITPDYLRLHIPALLKSLGYQAFVPLIKRLKLEARDNQLVVLVHVVVD
ncbi:MAG: hypothetical protein AAF597_01470 [Bacteroidota bacterium]